MPYEYTHRRTIQFAETDMAGIVHFANFFRMMEETEHAFFRSIGHSIHGEHEGRTIGWPRVNVACDYLRPLRFEDEIEIQLLIAEIRTRSVRYQFIFRKTADGTECARGNVTTVCATLDPTAGRMVSTPIPDTIRAKLDPAPASLIVPPRPQ